jgi:hypothetical protein
VFLGAHPSLSCCVLLVQHELCLPAVCGTSHSVRTNSGKVFVELVSDFCVIELCQCNIIMRKQLMSIGIVQRILSNIFLFYKNCSDGTRNKRPYLNSLYSFAIHRLNRYIRFRLECSLTVALKLSRSPIPPLFFPATA